MPRSTTRPSQRPCSRMTENGRCDIQNLHCTKEHFGQLFDLETENLKASGDISPSARNKICLRTRASKIGSDRRGAAIPSEPASTCRSLKRLLNNGPIINVNHSKSILPHLRIIRNHNLTSATVPSLASSVGPSVPFLIAARMVLGERTAGDNKVLFGLGN